jgi:GntR family transcriptional regulator/MocR family aminotransferase
MIGTRAILKTRRQLRLPIHAPHTVRGRLWEQVSEWLAWEMDMGRLQPGARVPATRTLARELGISRNTVALAYDELTSLGYLFARVGDGSYVAPVASRSRPPLFERRWDACTDPEGNRLMLIR